MLEKILKDLKKKQFCVKVSVSASTEYLNYMGDSAQEDNGIN